MKLRQCMTTMGQKTFSTLCFGWGGGGGKTFSTPTISRKCILVKILQISYL